MRNQRTLAEPVSNRNSTETMQPVRPVDAVPDSILPDRNRCDDLNTGPYSIARCVCLSLLFLIALLPYQARGDVVVPSTEEQRERWAQPRPEPVTLDLPGWTRSLLRYEHNSFPNRNAIEFERSSCSVKLIRDWDLPLTAGQPAKIESERLVTVGGRPVSLSTAMVFGIGQVQQLGLKGRGYEVDYWVLVRFKGCPDAVIENVLRQIEVHW